MIKLKPMSVSRINHYIHQQLKLDPILSNALVVGEISNFTRHSSGHLYFTIKDDASKINCIMFFRDADRLDFDPKVGDQVEIRGRVAVYEKEGRYQLNVLQMTPLGQGELYKAFMALKRSLSIEGYFDKKQDISKYPKRIGVITSPTGAAIRDVLTVFKKRHPGIDLILYPSLVQGDQAALQLATALDYFNESLPVDTILLCRGGGSIEDLWPFNERIVAEAIYASKIPVITGVGHETDFTISDFVADKRGATPSEAAMLACSPLSEQVDQLKSYKNSMVSAIHLYLAKNKEKLLKRQWRTMEVSIMDYIQAKHTDIDNSWTTLHNNIMETMTTHKTHFQELGHKLETLSPLKTLSRGYSVAMKDDQAIMDIESVKIGDSIDIVVKNGIIKCIAQEKKEGHNFE